MHSGERTLLHHVMVDAVHVLASGALKFPEKECCPFARHQGDRLDVVLRRGVRRRTCLDVAITFPLQSRATIAAASESSGGAATRYETVKVARYGEHAAEADMTFVPLVVVTFGAWGSSALPVLRELATQWGGRRGISPSMAVQQRMAVLNFVLLRGVGRLVLLFAAAAE